MDFVLFLVVALISFVGSIQIGAVSMAVIQTTLSRSRSAGIWVALGGSIPEFIFSFIALKGLLFLQHNQSIIDWLNILIIPIFLLLGLYSFFQKEPDNEEGLIIESQKNFDFAKGFSLGMINPQLLPFWFFSLVYISKYFSINTLSAKYAFVLGTGVGAFAILVVFAQLTHRYHLRIKKVLKNYPVNRLMAFVFIGLALIQAIKVFV
ncbi:MAG: LysE family transporter [Emticicia sp.]|nr:LysE family transporter [Emticicia sp.]